MGLTLWEWVRGAAAYVAMLAAAFGLMYVLEKFLDWKWPEDE